MAAVVPLWQLQAREKHKARLFGMMERLWDSPSKANPALIERDVAEAVRATRAVRTKIPRKGA